MDTIADLYREYFPYAGPCFFCGNRDKHHRMYEAIQGAARCRDGATPEALAYDYGLPLRLVQAILDGDTPTRTRCRYCQEWSDWVYDWYCQDCLDWVRYMREHHPSAVVVGWAAYRTAWPEVGEMA